MKTPRKSKVTHEQSLLGQLSKPLRDIVDDIRAHGPDALRKVRAESPVKYLELVTKVLPIIAALDPGRSDWSDCQSMEDIGRRLLKSVGFEDEDRMTDEAIQAAVAANGAFIERLGEIVAEAQSKELN